MRTPEDIKRGLECCCKAGYQAGGCKDCPYKSEPEKSCAEVMGNDAQAYIKQLEEGNEHQREKIRVLEMSLHAVNDGNAALQRENLMLEGRIAVMLTAGEEGRK